MENVKKYINEVIAEKGFNENGDIKIDFADICTEEETLQAAQELGYTAEKAEGQGVWWLSK